MSYTYVKIITLGDLNYTAGRIYRDHREKPSPHPRHQAYQGARPPAISVPLRQLYDRGSTKLYWSAGEPILVSERSYIGSPADQYGTVAGESYPLFRVLRLRTPSSPMYLFEVIRKSFALSRVFLLSSEGKSIVFVKKKAPSRRGILLSMHVVPKTRCVNPNIHARRY